VPDGEGGEGRRTRPRNALGRYPLPCERHDDTSSA